MIKMTSEEFFMSRLSGKTVDFSDFIDVRRSEVHKLASLQMFHDRCYASLNKDVGLALIYFSWLFAEDPVEISPDNKYITFDQKRCYLISNKRDIFYKTGSCYLMSRIKRDGAHWTLVGGKVEKHCWLSKKVVTSFDGYYNPVEVSHPYAHKIAIADANGQVQTYAKVINNLDFQEIYDKIIVS